MDDRKATPVFSGALAYFPRALKKIAKVSFKGNQKHNPGTPLHWAKNKSTDHPDSATRHILDPYDIDPDTNELSLFSAGWRIMAWGEVVATALDWNLCTIDELRSGLVTVASLSQRIHDIEENERNNQTQWATLTSSEAAELVLPGELGRAAWAEGFEEAHPICHVAEDTWANWGEANCMCDCSACYEQGTDTNCVEFEIDTDLEGADENGDEYFYDCLGGYQEVDVQPVVLYDIETEYKGSIAITLNGSIGRCACQCDLCCYDPEQFE